MAPATRATRPSNSVEEADLPPDSPLNYLFSKYTVRVEEDNLIARETISSGKERRVSTAPAHPEGLKYGKGEEAYGV